MTAFLLANWRFLAAGAAAAAFIGAGVLFFRALDENGRLTRELSASQALARTLTVQLTENQKALKSRTETAQALARERAKILETLEDLYANNEEACAWSAGRIPDAVLDRLCQPSAGSQPVLPPGGLPSGGPGTGHEGQD
jgi:hypothetical protein